jgi:hypothetical protein
MSNPTQTGYLSVSDHRVTNRIRSGAVTQGMAGAEFSGDETNGHYIEVHGPGSESEVLDALTKMVTPESIELADNCPPVITLHGGRTIVFVDVAPGPDGPITLAIGDLDHDDEARGRAAEQIRSSLASGTSWRLSGSFDAENPDVRPASRTSQIATSVRAAIGMHTRYLTGGGAFCWRPVDSGLPRTR